MQSPESFYRVLLKNVPREDEDPVSGLCFEHGASGVSENLKFHQESLQYDPVIVETPFLDLDVFFETEPSPEFLEKIQRQWPDVEVMVTEEAQKDWNEEWKKGFVEFELVKDIWVVPSWREAPVSARSVISIDPGMAFGTGTHETTRLASQALLENSEHWGEQFSLMEVGTGTGILAMLALELGAHSVVATEIDEVAREVARENVERNQKSRSIEIPDVQVEAVEGMFPLVVANIIDGVLVNIQQALKARTQPGGALLLTGILEERESWFRENFKLPHGYGWRQRWQMNEWVALLGAPE